MRHIGAWLWRHRAGVVLFLVLCLCVSMFLSKYGLTVSRYTIPGNVTAPIRVVQLSDLHGMCFGENNRRLLRRLEAEKPDLILLTGDMVNMDEADVSVSLALIEALSALAPVYASFGNHEIEHMARYGTDLVALWTAAGATVLDDTHVDVSIKGQAVRIGGLFGYVSVPEEYVYGPHGIYKNAMLRRYCYMGEDRLQLLLCHMPVSWVRGRALDAWGIDVVFSGHAHGGQIRLPLIGGVVAPDQGLFPGRVSGVYTSADGTGVAVLSRGLGSGSHVPRLNNIPEIVVCDIVPKVLHGEEVR